MKIRLTGSYRGKPSGERIIAPGDYAVDDERLFGLADYLVKNGHAIRVTAEGKPAKVATVAGDDVQFFSNMTGEPVPVVVGNNPDLTTAETQAVIDRYQLALELKAKADTALEAEQRAGDTTPPQGEDIYHLHQPLAVALHTGDLVTIPGKGIVPDVTLPKAVWEMGRDIVFPVEPPTTVIVPEETVTEFDYDEARVSFADTVEYQSFQREREIALSNTMNEQRANEIQADFDARARVAEAKWQAAQVAAADKPKGKRK